MKHYATLQSLFSKWNLEGAYVAGDEFWACCPWHNEKRAAFSVNLESGKWSCLACHVKGRNIMQLVARMEGISDDKAEDVLERFGVDTIAALKEELREMLRAKLESRQQKVDRTSTDEWKKYSEEIPGYLVERGFTPEVIKQHRIGFNRGDRTVCIPVFEQDICRFVYTRVTWKKTGVRMPSYHYPKGVDKAHYLWGMDRPLEDYAEAPLYLCEGSLDALWLRQHGFSNAFAVLGSYMSWDQVKRVESMAPSEVVLVFDNDKAGFDCTVSTAKMLLKSGFSKVYYAPYAKGVGDPQSATAEQLHRMIKRKKSVRPLLWGQQPSKRMAALLSA